MFPEVVETDNSPLGFPVPHTRFPPFPSVEGKSEEKEPETVSCSTVKLAFDGSSTMMAPETDSIFTSSGQAERAARLEPETLEESNF